MKVRIGIVALLAGLLMVTGCSKKEEVAAPAPAPATEPAAAPVAAAEPAAAPGEEVYQKACAACHAEGVAGAPKTGDIEGWKARLEKGPEALVQSAINGIGTMPARGGVAELTDEEVAAATNLMIEQSK
ncbi:MAG: c-type cytochrome [Trichloromonadaceae bacterium]